ncbi:MAG: BCCT family transporter [Eubacteriales bacterium]|nr:BCCT family transporter [Eubacteriales bacterium]
MKKINSVFIISLLVVAFFTLWGIISPATFGEVADKTFGFLTEKFGWFYLIVMFSFVVFVLVIAASKYGDIRLGPDDSKPEYSNISWFAMLFSAGMGIGLVFWGVAEPLNHFLFPGSTSIVPGSPEAADFAILSSIFHWGLHPWANYTIIALPLAYMQFRKNKPGLISSIFIPLIGEEKVRGPIGKIIDILAIFATVAGVATSLGLGVLQINSGMNYLFGTPINNTVGLIIIVVVTGLFMASAISGINKGIKFLSNANIALAGILMLLTFILGPSLKIVNSLVNGIGQYLFRLVPESMAISAFGDNSWIAGWRIFYWAWWIAWAPFVGMFIARISRGRTIREFILGVTVIPALGSAIWFAIFGTTGLNLGEKIASEAVKVTETAFFVVMKEIPWGGLISGVAVILLCTFFITSADSATFVLGMLSSGGDLNPHVTLKVIWGLIQSGMAYALLLAGGLQVLQTASIVAAFPFAFVMIFAMVSFVKALKKDPYTKISEMAGPVKEVKAEPKVKLEKGAADKF